MSSRFSISVLTHDAVKQLLPKRANDSHKGQNGRVLIVGGSYEYHGAPLLSALGAFRSGCDLVYLFVPESNFAVSRNFLPELIVKSYLGQSLSIKSLSLILEMLTICDVLLIGPGIGKRTETKELVIELLSRTTVPIVIDAEAILPWKDYKQFRNSEVVLTPHQAELETMMGNLFQKKNMEKNVQAFATLHQINILVKGRYDLIVDREGIIARSDTGNPGLTGGGTGDVLSGVVAGLLSQGLNPFAAMYLGAYCVGVSGDRLAKTKGYGFLAHEVGDGVAEVLSELKNSGTVSD